jgi:hypothetical protein
MIEEGRARPKHAARAPLCHSRESGNPFMGQVRSPGSWIPASAGMTEPSPPGEFGRTEGRCAASAPCHWPKASNAGVSGAAPSLFYTSPTDRTRLRRACGGRFSVLAGNMMPAQPDLAVWTIPLFWQGPGMRFSPFGLPAERLRQEGPAETRADVRGRRQSCGFTGSRASRLVAGFCWKPTKR